MRNLKKIFVFLLVVVLACLSLFSVACNRDSEIDTSKVQIYVSNYNGGFGDEWLQKIKTDFESGYSDYVFEDKKGVQIIINNHKANSAELAAVSASKNEVYFLSGSYYEEAIKGNFLDITDIVTEGGENSLESKLSPELKAFFKSYNGKYYGLPRQEAVYGFVYNVDKFDEEQLYFRKNGCPSEDGYTGSYKYTNLAGERSTGPNGEYGDYDDGLPATYEELFQLFVHMNDKGITPMTWTGWYYLSYLSWLLQAIAYDYEGAENLTNYYNLQGEITTYVESIIEKPNSLFDTLSLSSFNAANEKNKVYGTAGRYYALKVIEKIFSNEMYYDEVNAFKGTVSHTDAQYNFLDDENNIAMLVEGSWWENEAKASFELLDKDMDECRFAMMPLPKVSKEYLGAPTYSTTEISFAFINANANPDKIPLLKEFYKYCYSQERLEEFTVLTNTPISLNYSISDETMGELTHFGKSIWDIHCGTNGAKIVYTISSNQSVLAGMNSYKYTQTFKSSVNNEKTTYPFDLFRSSSVSAFDYFKGIQKYFNEN